MAHSQKADIELGIVRYEYGDKNRKQMAVLQIETDKYHNGGLLSDASVYWVGASMRSRCMSLGGSGFSDYDKRLKLSPGRATQNAIDKQHMEVFTKEVLASLVEYAKLHYARFVRDGKDDFGNTYEK